MIVVRKPLKKMVNYFKLVKQYREQETELYRLNDEIKQKYDNYSETMKNLNSAKNRFRFLCKYKLNIT